MAAIVASDIKFYMAVTTGSTGFSTAQANPNASLGKYVSTSLLTTALFDDVTGSENDAGHTDYRCFFILNNHATLVYSSAKIWIDSQGAGGSTVSFAVDDIAAKIKSSSTAQAAQVASETVAPTGISAWSTATTEGTALALGDIPAGYVKAVWLRRITSSAQATADNVTMRVTGDTSA